MKKVGTPESRAEEGVLGPEWCLEGWLHGEGLGGQEHGEQGRDSPKAERAPRRAERRTGGPVCVESGPPSALLSNTLPSS